MLLHVNASGYNGGVVSIPPQSIVNVPGHGRMEIEEALVLGGPSLLVQTVQDLTHIQIDHYARIDFSHVGHVVNVMGGVNVTLPDVAENFEMCSTSGLTTSMVWLPGLRPPAEPQPGRAGAPPAKPDPGGDS